jgi:hypothetical protein
MNALIKAGALAQACIYQWRSFSDEFAQLLLSLLWCGLVVNFIL